MKPFRDGGELLPSSPDLRRLAVQGAGATVLSSVGGLAVQVGSTVILARLLTPADFGVVTMVTTFCLLFSNFGLNGFTEAILQCKRLDHCLASNLFWINLGAGVILTVSFAAAGSLLTWFYRDSRVARVAIGMSLTIFVTSISVLHLAFLKRALRFSALSANNLCSRGVSVIVSILMARSGWGYWALVGGAIAQPLSQSVGAWILCPWLPSLPRRVEGTASLVWFASNVYGRFSLNYLARNLDNVLVGWRFDSVSLGFYKKAYDLFSLSAGLLVSSLSNVAVAALSRFTANPPQYRQYILNTLTVTAFVGMGVGADLTLVGNDVIRLLLGPGWAPAGQIFTLFGPGIGIMLLYGTHGWIHLSTGNADRWLRWGMVEFAVTALLFLVALPWGPEGIAIAWTASFWILTIPAFWYAVKPIDLDIPSILMAVWRYPIASIIGGGVSWLLMGRLSWMFGYPTALGAFLRILAASAVFGAVYLASVALMCKEFEPFFLVARIFREMFPGVGRKALFLVGESTAGIDTTAPVHSSSANSVGIELDPTP